MAPKEVTIIKNKRETGDQTDIGEGWDRGMERMGSSLAKALRA